MAIFCVRQLAWPCIYWHAFISYAVLLTSRGTRPTSALQRSLPWTIAVVLLMAAISIILMTLSYVGLTGISPLLIEVILSAACLCFVMAAYVGPCFVLVRRTKGGVGGAYFQVTRARNMAISKLIAVLSAFILVWAFMVVSGIQYLLDGDRFAVDVPSALMAVLDSIILGNLFGGR